MYDVRIDSSAWKILSVPSRSCRNAILFSALAQENVILHAGNDFFSRAIGQTEGKGCRWATFDKGVMRTWMGSFPRDNCPELFQSEGVVPWLLIKTSRLLKRGWKTGGRLRMGWKRILACRPSPPPTRSSWGRDSSQFKEQDGEDDGSRKERSQGEKKGWREGKGRDKEREKSRRRHGKKSGEGFGLDYRGRILLITGVLWGHETKRFPFNCVPGLYIPRSFSQRI